MSASWARWMATAAVLTALRSAVGKRLHVLSCPQAQPYKVTAGRGKLRGVPHFLHLVFLRASGPPAPTQQRQRPAPFCSPNPTTGAGDREGRGWRKAPCKGQVGAELRAGKRAVLGGRGLEVLHANAPCHQASHKPTASGRPLSPHRLQAQPPRGPDSQIV